MAKIVYINQKLKNAISYTIFHWEYQNWHLLLIRPFFNSRNFVSLDYFLFLQIIYERNTLMKRYVYETHKFAAELTVFSRPSGTTDATKQTKGWAKTKYCYTTIIQQSRSHRNVQPTNEYCIRSKNPAVISSSQIFNFYFSLIWGSNRKV